MSERDERIVEARRVRDAARAAVYAARDAAYAAYRAELDRINEEYPV